MEVDLVKENHHNANCNENESPEQLMSVESSEICNIFGDPEVLPRIGEEYQVEVPPLPLKSDSPGGDHHGFSIGLPVPVMWISEKFHFMKHTTEMPGDDSVEISNKTQVPKSECFKEVQAVLEGEDKKPDIKATETTITSRLKVCKVAELALQKETKSELHQKNNINGCSLVPGVLGDSWSNIEEASFLLGLYIFGKNLVLVKKFVGSKHMGDVLSFYYGKFFRSDKYRRWSECRKARGRKCIYGQRLFKGWRQQELISRLLPHAREGSKNALMEDSKAFGDGKMLLEEYVFSIKATIGLEAFVEAVGIGKGKQDLTGISMEPPKSNHVVSVRPEIPVGKACSSLTPLEIVNYLTGDFRLSKARSSDLFWEAVWPRLLARGWHSEQPNGCTTGTKHSLVFLVPGIKKYSRRKLVRGNHYFDSVSDVLGKVASDPRLLELDNNADKGGKSREENGWTDDAKLDQEDFPFEQRHCYLKPRTPAHNTDAVKFTVVDTSLVNGNAVRELRSLPVELLSVSSSRCYSAINDLDSSDESVKESDFEENPHFDKNGADASHAARRKNKDQRVYSNGNHFSPDASNQVFPLSEPESAGLMAEVSKKDSTISFEGTQPRNAIVHRFSQKTRTDNKRQLSNVTKKHRKLNAFGSKSTATNILVAPKLKEEEACCSKDSPASTSENFLPRADLSQEKSSCSSGCNPVITLDRNPKETASCFNQSRALIDLNLPIPPDAELDEPVKMEMRGPPDQTSKVLDNPSVVKPSDVPDTSDQQIHNSRRLSCRNRPPTARALEARALGLLDVKQKRKSKDAFPEENAMARPPRRPRPKMKPAENLGIGIEDFKIEDRAVSSSTISNNSEAFSKLEV